MAQDKDALLAAGHKVVLDGSATHKDLVTAFDAHDKVLRNVGDYEHQEYPKAVAHDENGEPVVAQNEDHEAELAEKAEESA